MRTVVGGGRDTHDGHENSPILVFFSNLLGAAPAIFFLLGVARLLVLALPTTLIASHTMAIHAFSQVLVAGLLVAGLAMLSARSVGRQNPARRAVGAIGVGIVAALAAGP